MVVEIIGVILSIIGLACAAIGGLVLLPKILITQEELDLLASIPVEPSTSHMTGEVSGENRNVALTDISSLEEYRKVHLEARRQEQTKGIQGLRFIVGAFLLQVLGSLCMLFG